MAEKNQNIRQRLEERYPEPGIPAEEGWKSMEALLGAAMPAAPPPAPPRFPLLSVIATAAAVGFAGLAIFLVTRNSPDQPLQSTGSHFGTETLQPPARMTEPDTTIPVQKPVSTQEPVSVHEPVSVLEPASVRKSVPVPGNSPVNTTALSPYAGSVSREEVPIPGKTSSVTHSDKAHVAPSGKETGGFSPPSARPSSSGARENASGRIIAEVVAPEEAAGTGANTEVPQLGEVNRERAYQSPALSGIRLPVPKPPTPKKEPEISDANTAEESSFNWGLQWMANFPVAGRKAYVSDLKEQYGAYILAIPGVWASRKIGNRQEVILSARPYFDYYSKNELFFQNSVLDTRPDSMPIPKAYPQDGRLLKLRSSGVTGEYHYRFAGNFLIGGELSYQHHWNALANIRRLSSSGFSPAVDSLEWLGRNDDFWKYLRPGNVTAGLSLTYRTSSLSLGGSVLMPLFPTPKELYGAKPLNSRIFIRWQLKPPKKAR